MLPPSKLKPEEQNRINIGQEFQASIPTMNVQKEIPVPKFIPKNQLTDEHQATLVKVRPSILRIG